MSQDEIDDFLNQIPSLPKITYDTSALSAPITTKEITEAIKSLQNGKAPGCDGLTAEFYKSCEELVVPILLAVFQAVWEQKMLTPMQKVAIIILLFKKGDHHLLSNFRLISLTNRDYKILAYILSNCLNDHLSDVIAVNQTAYMLGRFISTNIWSIQDTIDYFAKCSLPSLILFLDFRKAFDSVSHSFLFALLHHISLPEEFIVCVKIMYHEVYSKV